MTKKGGLQSNEGKGVKTEGFDEPNLSAILDAQQETNKAKQ